MTSPRRLASDSPIVWRSPHAVGDVPPPVARAGVFVEDGPAPFVTVRCDGDNAAMKVRADQVFHRADYGMLHAISPENYPSPLEGHGQPTAENAPALELSQGAQAAIALADVAPATAEGRQLLVDILAALCAHGIDARPVAGPTDPSALGRAGCVVAGHGDQVLVTWAFAHGPALRGKIAARHLLEGIALLLTGPHDERGPLYTVELQQDEDNGIIGLLLKRAHPR